MCSDLPKVLHEVNSKPMVVHVVNAAQACGPQRIVCVIGKKRPQIKDVLPSGVRVAWQSRPIGTADAVKAAIPQIPSNSKDVIVLYGDTPLITPQTIEKLFDFHITSDSSCTVLSAHFDRPKGYGRILRNDAGDFIGIVEERDAHFKQKAIKEINTGMYCFRRQDLLEALDHVEAVNQGGEFYLTDVFSWLFRRGKKISACVADDATEVLGVNTQAELDEASRVLRLRILSSFAARGVEIKDFSSTFIDESVQIAEGTKILPFTVIEEEVRIGRDCRIGPFCHLRPGTVLCDKVHIGNFAEVKNSQVGDASKMGHVGYLGDTAVGKGVNIGAGSIVANFDGTKKNKTRIKDRAFIGSNVVLIAPVDIGRGAVVGAGSVVTRKHHVADKTVVAGNPARVLKKG